MGMSRNLKQDVTHWAVTGSDGFGGFSYDPPVLLKGRWQDKQEMFLTADGEEKISNAVVYVSVDVDAGDYLALGDHATTPVLNPTSGIGARRIRGYGKSTDLRSIESLRKVWL